MRVSKIYLSEGGLMPRCYGVAYLDYMRQEFVCYPIPFNLFVNWGRKLYYRIAGPSIPEIELKINDAYHKGVQRGWKLRQKRLEELIDEQFKR